MFCLQIISFIPAEDWKSVENHDGVVDVHFFLKHVSGTAALLTSARRHKLAWAFALSRVTEILMQLTLQVENIFHIFEIR